jgi:G3E family GTPase
MPIPVTLIGGYLGAGKTTLVNHLLRERGERRIAVLVNDFGELPIDDALIESRDGTLLQLAGGCVCCSFGSDLMAALQQMLALQPQPEHILIETSGVALPAAVARVLGLLPDCSSMRCWCWPMPRRCAGMRPTATWASWCASSCSRPTCCW